MLKYVLIYHYPIYYFLIKYFIKVNGYKSIKSINFHHGTPMTHFINFLKFRNFLQKLPSENVTFLMIFWSFAFPMYKPALLGVF
jgi:hypothetical protein